jgi:hypothetical protein
MDYDVVLTHPFLITTYDSQAKVLSLEADYLYSERLQTSTIAFEVPTDNSSFRQVCEESH